MDKNDRLLRAACTALTAALMAGCSAWMIARALGLPAPWAGTYLLAALGFVVLGLPGSPLLGLFVGAMNVIPYLGPFLGGVPAVASALGFGWERALLALMVLVGVQQIDGMVISPRVMGSVTGFSPAVVLLASGAGYVVFKRKDIK